MCLILTIFSISSVASFPQITFIEKPQMTSITNDQDKREIMDTSFTLDQAFQGTVANPKFEGHLI